MAIPFDSLCLAAVVAELQTIIGGRVQQVDQTGEHEFVLSIYLHGLSRLLMTAHSQFARVHLIQGPFKPVSEPSAFQKELRKRLGGARLASVKQRGFDRVIELEFTTAEGPYLLIGEFMGKHSNLMLLDESHRIVGAERWIGPGKSKRLILPNRKYEPPPFPARKPIWESDGRPLQEFEGASPFLLGLIESGAVEAEEIGEVVRSLRFESVFVPGQGAYPIPIAKSGLCGKSAASYSEAAERWFSEAERAAWVENERASLLGQLERVLLARDVAISDLRQALDTAVRAREFQEKGELILAHQRSIDPGASTIKVEGYDGKPLDIALKIDATAVENAERYFSKAKRAKAGAEGVRERLESLESDRKSLVSVIELLSRAVSPPEIENARVEADARRWLHHQPIPTRIKEERPYQGHSIRETSSPSGWKVLWAENATSNDFLTMRVAKPNDWWLHVRGAPSAHVILVTGNHPEKVQRQDLLFAATIAVKNSSSKHSKYVPVDYTLKKYVRKPRGSAPGAALYEREKTLFVD